MERCQSGWMGRSRKPLCTKMYRGFESLSFRQYSLRKHCRVRRTGLLSADICWTNIVECVAQVLFSALISITLRSSRVGEGKNCVLIPLLLSIFVEQRSSSASHKCSFPPVFAAQTLSSASHSAPFRWPSSLHYDYRVTEEIVLKIMPYGFWPLIQQEACAQHISLVQDLRSSGGGLGLSIS